jgi:hypothetical protein
VTVIVRDARPADLAGLEAIEMTADAMFRRAGIRFPPGPCAVTGAMEHGADILVTGDPPVGFAALMTVDGRPHLAQISVLASHGGRGVGTVLLAETIRRSGPGLTLITFRDVPWNGPWYLRHGFAELPPDRCGPQLRAEWQAEIDAGLHELGPRLIMEHPGPPGPGTGG